jgi:hypothetical protein
MPGPWSTTQHIGLAVFLAGAAIVAVWGTERIRHPSRRDGQQADRRGGLRHDRDPYRRAVPHRPLAQPADLGLGHPGQAGGGWQLAIVYLYVMCWTAYGTEIAATFSLEYRDQRRDTPRVLLSGGLLTLAFLELGPLASTGVVGEKEITAQPVGFFIPVFSWIIGPAASLLTIVICDALFVNMTAATADAGRALYVIARDGMTVHQLFHLNKQRMPALAMTIDLVVNLCLVFFVANTPGHLVRQQPRLHDRDRLRAYRVRAAAPRPPSLATPDQARPRVAGSSGRADHLGPHAHHGWRPQPRHRRVRRDHRPASRPRNTGQCPGHVRLPAAI